MCIKLSISANNKCVLLMMILGFIDIVIDDWWRHPKQNDVRIWSSAYDLKIFTSPSSADQSVYNKKKTKIIMNIEWLKHA